MDDGGNWAHAHAHELQGPGGSPAHQPPCLEFGIVFTSGAFATPKRRAALARNPKQKALAALL
jgi:hypothetical protein